MPFTFSHPAIVLPFAFLPKRWFSMTGLIIGSMSPDFEYFIRMNILSRFGHTWQGMLTFDLPMGLAVAFIFHNIVRNTLYDHLPPFLKARLCSFKTFNWNYYFIKNWWVVVLSILIGAASHIFWDGFTHETGLIVEFFPGLLNPVELAGFQRPMYNVLQHTSTVVGGGIILWTLFRLPVASYEPGWNAPFYWSIVVGVTIMILGVRLLDGLKYHLLGILIVNCISAFLLALIVTPLALKFIKR